MDNPYVGPRPIESGQALYGRERETLELVRQLSAERIVLLHSPSGAGKTSLVQAALLPQMEARKFLPLPILRVSLADKSLAPEANRYLASVLTSLESARPRGQNRPLADWQTLGLADYLDERQSEWGDKARPLLIFDQFEEILTLSPADLAAKREFFRQVGEALEDRRRWALFVMREDYVAALDPYRDLIPNRLTSTFHLDLLDEASARLAIQKPASEQRVKFTDEAAIKLVDDLRQIQVQRPDGVTESQPGPYVEPVQLQVVCYRLWEQLPPGVDAITVENVSAVGSVNAALAAYYADKVKAAADQTGVGERAIREWVGDQLITPQGIRGQVLQGPETSAGLSNRAIQLLIDSHLVRAEKRRGASWFELAHDRLIEPVLQNNADWRSANLALLQRQVELWADQGRPDGLLLSGLTLTEAEAWASAHAAELTEAEYAFLDACRLARLQNEKEARRQQVVAFSAFGALLAAVLAIFFAINSNNNEARAEAKAAEAATNAAQAEINATIAYYNLSTATAALSTAEAAGLEVSEKATESAFARETAEHSRSELATAAVTLVAAESTAEAGRAQVAVALSRQLAAQARGNLTDNLDLALLLGIEAYKYSDTAEARAVLQAGVELKLGRSVEPVTGPAPQISAIRSVAFSPDGAQLAWGSGNAVVLWEVQTQRVSRLPQIHTARVNSLAFSPDGLTLASGADDGQVLLWEVASRTAPTSVEYQEGDQVLSVAISPPGGETLATGRVGSTIILWDLASGNFGASSLIGHRDTIESVAFSSDGTRLASGGDDTEVRIWNVEDRETTQVLRGHRNVVLSVAWSPDDRFVASAGRDGNLVIWDINVVPPVSQTLAIGSELYTVAFSPSGGLLAAGGFDGQVRVWKFSEGRVLTDSVQIVAEHDRTVFSLAFSAGPNPLIASGSSDGVILVRRLNSAAPVDQPLPELACTLLDGRKFTVDELEQYFPGEADRETCPP